MTEHTRRILIIDDNRALHGEVRAALGGRASGDPAAVYEISSVYRDADGIERARTAIASGQPYAVALVDVRAPSDGLRTVAALHEIDAELEIVICSALPDAGELIRRLGDRRSQIAGDPAGFADGAAGLACGIDRVILARKPLDLAALAPLVHALAHKSLLARRARARDAELAHARAQLAVAAAVYEATADGLLIVGPDRKVHTASRRFLEMWNLPAEAVQTHSPPAMLRAVLDQLIEPEAAVARIAHLDAHPEEIGVDEVRLKDGRVMERWSGPVRSPAGAILGRLWVFRDVTERRRFELDRAVVTERMAAMGRLAAGVGHEINNPLTYALGNIESLLEASAARGTPPAATEVVERLQEARDGLARIRVIVGDLQTLARADESHGEVDLQQVIEQAIQIAGAELRHRAPIVRNYQPAPPILGSRIRLGQVFLNLVINAAQAIPEGQAAQNRIEIAIRDAGDAVVVEVTDTGCGIAPEHLARIFDPFFTTKEVGAGTGLGLAISRDIVASHRGTLTARSTPGAGTTMTVSIPHTARKPKPAAPPVEAAPASRRARVLVIDDEPLIARILQRGLSRHQVIVASDAREALTWIQRGDTFDVILCDLMMPDISGIDVHEYLSREYPAVASRVVFMTGGAFTSKARQFLSSVPNERIDKPFSLSQVNKLVDRRLAASPP